MYNIDAENKRNERFEKILIRVKKGEKEFLQKKAEAMGVSLNAYILFALDFFEKNYNNK